MDRILLLAFAFVIFGNGNGLDFSQFYLPPCCYISPQGDHFSGYASPSSKEGVNTKRHVNSLNSSQLVRSDFKNHNFTASASQTSFQPIKVKPLMKAIATKRVYSLVIPLDEIIYKTTPISTTERPETTQMKPPITGRILFPESRNKSKEVSKFKRDSNPVIHSKTKLLEQVLTLELEDAESRKSTIGKKSLVEEAYHHSATLQPEHRILSNPDQFEKHYENWEPKKIKNKSRTIHSKSVPIRFLVSGKPDPLLASTSADSVKRQAVRKMPASWLKNLRRAIYHSIATGADNKPQHSNQEEPLQDRARGQSSPKSSIAYPETWKNIQGAKLQYIDKMSQVASDINGPIFLPLGQGPVVSGVLVNNNEGGLQLRVASELYEYDGANDINPGCHCYLVNNGEILVAYWSVSRIFNEKGLPALQYLVYPLPFSVPTPPDYIPFSNDPMFRPSQVDPLTNYYEQIHRNKYYEQQQHQQIHEHNQIGNYHEDLRLVHRDPKFVHELPNGHHRIELHDQMPIPSPIPTFPSPTELGPPPAHQGVLIEKNRQYTPEFIELYHRAVQHQLQQQDDERRMFHGTPFPPNVPIDGPVNYQDQPNLPLPTPTQFTNTPPEQFVQPRPVLLPDPTGFPVQDDQISKPPTYPNSIQDIISPFSRPSPESEFGPQLLQQVPQGVGQPYLQQIPIQFNQGINPQEFINQQQISIQFNQGINPQEFLNQQQIPIQNQGIGIGTAQPYPPSSVQLSGRRPSQNKNKNNYRDKTNENASYDDNRQGDDSQRPYTVSNVLDNEKKYYPRRKPSNNFVNTYSESKSPYKRRPNQPSDNVKGYILDF